MTFQNYFYTPKEFAGDIISYEEQLLLDYDDFMQGSFSKTATTFNHFDLKLEELEDDFESEYDENDWEEEEDSDENLPGEYDRNEEKPGTFEMRN